MIVLDTHAAVWWTQSPERLGTKAKKAIGSADLLLIPAIVLWEVALLVRKERLALKGGRSVQDWAAEVLSIPRVREVPLSSDLALRADALEMHADPADRFIAAATLHAEASLVTKDKLLAALRWLPTVW